MMLFAIGVPNTDAPAIIALCLAMTIGLLWYVFQVPAVTAEAPEKTRLAYLRERKEVVYDNLRDLNFEYKAGKFPDADYQQIRAALEDEAAALLAEIESLENGAPGMNGTRSGQHQPGRPEMKGARG
jgi:hypothetical protein